MITLTALGTGSTTNSSFSFTSLADGEISERTSTSFKVSFGSNHYVDITGYDFVHTYDADAAEYTGTPTSGTVTSYSIHEGSYQYDVAGLEEPVTALSDAASLETTFARLFDANNIIAGDSGDDYFVGGTGADTIISGEGDDYLTGDAGDDDLNAGDGHDLILGGEGNDRIVAGAGDDGIEAGSGNNTIYAGDGDDSITTADNGDNFIDGGDGYDYIVTGDGVDTIYGGGMSDYIIAGGGNDTVYGDGGDDSAYLGEGDDTFYGGAGNDYASATSGTDYEVLSGGTNTMYGGEGNDYLEGGDGVDTLFGEAGNDGLVGGAGNDELTGGEGSDFLHGGDGDDTIYAGAGTDEVYGGAGADSFVYENVSEIGDIFRDFNATSLSEGDRFVFQGVNFQDLPEGYLDERYFNHGVATNGLHKFTYHAGALWFDFDGYAGPNSDNYSLVGQVVNGHQVTASDIYITRIQEGTDGDDTMHGGRYTDHFIATLGNDTYTGYEDADDYIYNDVSFGGDLITDFNIFHGDAIHVKSENFNNLEVGTLSEDNFVLNDTGLAGDADDYFIFNTEEQVLYYDADGSGSQAAVNIATFQNLDEYSWVTNENILVIA